MDALDFFLVRYDQVHRVPTDPAIARLGERQLRGLFFQRAARLLDLLVLSFDFDVSLGKLLRLLRELFVGLLKFLLLCLKFDSKLLRLFEQAFGLHCRFDTVEDNAGTYRQLLEETQVSGLEIV